MKNDLFAFTGTQSVTLHVGDCLEILRQLPTDHFHACVTSPPYYNLRDYNVAGQVGLEDHPDAYVAKLVAVFREVRRTLRSDGTLWLNLGDSYAGAGYSNHYNTGGAQRTEGEKQRHCNGTGLKNKDLLMIPARVALALQADGWWLRSDIIWQKPNPMPESVQDRPTSAHEHVFLLTKSPKYYYDHESIKEPSVMRPQNRGTKREDHPKGDEGRGMHCRPEGGTSYSGRNARNVWTITPKPFKGAHFATMPPDLVKPCVLAGCPADGEVLDPFGGAGTTGLVAAELGRRCTLIELNPDYATIIRQRLGDYLQPTPEQNILQNQ